MATRTTTGNHRTSEAHAPPMPRQSEAQPLRCATAAMGTRFEIVLANGTARSDEPFLRAAAEEAIARIEEMHHRLSRFQRGSLVHEINALAGQRPVRVDDEIFDLFTRCVGYESATGGAFRVVRGGPKARLTLDPSRRTVTLTDTSGTDAPPPVLDLGAVAKGFAIDLAAQSLRDAGVESALIHGGSSTIAAIGSPPGRDAWNVLLDSAATGEATAVVRLRDRAFSVSSQHGDRPGHVIDPATGRPAAGTPWAACLAASAEATDAYSTAMVVLGARPAALSEDITTLVPAAPGGTTLNGVSGVLARGPDADSIAPHPGRADEPIGGNA